MKKYSKEELILKVVNEGKKTMKKTQKDYEEMIRDYKENGFGDMHPDNIEGYKSGLNYTLGYTFGHLILLKDINDLIKMTPEQIEDLIKENKRIDKENKKYISELFARLKEKL